MPTDRSTVFPSSGSMAVDQTSGIVYSIGAGRVTRWDANTGEFLEPIELPGNLAGIAVSPDGRWLLVGSRDLITVNGQSHVVVNRIDLTTMEQDVVTIEADSYESGVADIAVAADGMVLFTTTFMGSGWTPLRFFDVADTDAVPTLVPGVRDVRGGSDLIASPSGNFILVTESNISNGPIGLYSTQQGRIIAETDLYASGLSGFNDGRADINDAGFIAVVTYNTFLIYDRDLNVVRDFSSGSHIADAQFSHDGRHLFVLNVETDRIEIYQTSDWTMVGGADVGADLWREGNGSPHGRLDLVGDGELLLITTPVGVRVIDLVVHATTTSRGTDVSDTLYGTVGADVLIGEGGDDYMEGFRGDDTYHVDSRGDVVAEVAGGGIDTVLSTVSFDARTIHVENITLTGDANVNAVGNDLDNIIIGNVGANILKGLGGDDTYHVDSLDDVVVETAGGGIDTVLSTVNFDARATHVENITLTGDANVNAVGNDLNNILIGNSAANIFKGLGGDDVMEGHGGNDTYVVNSRGDVVIEVAGGGVDRVVSTVSFDARFTHVENIVLTGEADANVVANDLNNIIVGNSAANILKGLGGDDTYYVDSRDDVVIEAAGGGIDTVFSTVSFDGRLTHIENITLTGSANANAVGNDLNNTIIGNSAANILKGLGGNDTYVVDSRDDVVIEVAGGGIDTVLSTVSFDARTTHVENITLTGAANANAVANNLNNVITGNSAANIIIGYGGADIMTGGGGADTFRYNAVSDSSFADYDRIMDLGADDFIDLRNIDANANAAGNQSFTRVDELTGQAGQMTLTWLASAGFTLMSMDVDGDGVADMRIVLYGDHSDFDNFLGVGG